MLAGDGATLLTVGVTLLILLLRGFDVLEGHFDVHCAGRHQSPLAVKLHADDLGGSLQGFDEHLVTRLEVFNPFCPAGESLLRTLQFFALPLILLALASCFKCG